MDTVRLGIVGLGRGYSRRIPVALTLGNKVQQGHGGADKKMMMAFVNSILNDTPVPIDADMGIAMTIPGIIAHQSAQQDGAVLEIPQI